MEKLKLYDIISESVHRDMFEGFNEAQLSEDYPVNFDIFQFKNIRSYAGKLRYAAEHLGKPIGSGSSRSVYRVDNYKVLKLAKNNKGVVQNECEIDWSGESYFENVLAKIFDYDRENHFWVEMELAMKARKSDFKRLWGIRFEDFDLYLMNKEVEYRGRRPMWRIEPEVMEQMDNNDKVQEVLNFMVNTDSQSGDLGRISSWGLVKRQNGENLVLIDFGLTNEVYESYYR